MNWFACTLITSKYRDETRDTVLNCGLKFSKRTSGEERCDRISAEPVCLVRTSAEDRVSISKSVRPGRWFVTFAGSAGEEDVIELRVVYVKLIWTDSDNRTIFCRNIL